MTKAPLLPATSVPNYGYMRLFYGCSKINYIKMLALNATIYVLSQWVYGVSSTGTFVKHPEATWDIRGDNGVPNGWTIKFDGEEEDEGSIIQFKIDGWSYTAIEGMTWEQWVESGYYNPSYGENKIYVVENTVYVYAYTSPLRQYAYAQTSFLQSPSILSGNPLPSRFSSSTKESGLLQ